MRGIVKRWVRSRGYGFIEPQGSDESILIHHTDLEGYHELKEGQKVEFEVDKTGPRPRAMKVKAVD